jgi:hypothetical protein
VGLERFPHLRSLRPRLAALADMLDPLELQVALAAAMLDADTQAPEVFFVDDHFVAYTGAAPVAKDWNTRRRHAEAGHDDTLIVDDRWRAICFSSGPLSSLSSTMVGSLAGLRTITNGARVMIGFDRGGSFPKAFAHLVEEGFDWVSYRRAPLASPTRPPAASWVSIEGHRHYLCVADEVVYLAGYGPARQISVYEGDRVALQILTSKTDAPAARLAHVLRCRWCIENTFKYLEAHQGMHWMADYHMERRADPGLVANPARTQAKAALATALSEVAELERLIGTTTTSANSTNLVEVNATLVVLGRNLDTARSAATQAKAALAPIPAKIAATTLRPTPRGPGPGPVGVPYRWSVACWPTTRSWILLDRSTPTSPIRTSTAPSPATCSTNPGGSPSARAPSRSVSEHPIPLGWPKHCQASSARSTPTHPASPPTAARSPTRSSTNLDILICPNYRRSEPGTCCSNATEPIPIRALAPVANPHRAPIAHGVPSGAVQGCSG